MGQIYNPAAADASPVFTGTVTFPDGATWKTTGITDSQSYSTASTPIQNWTPTWTYTATGSGSTPFKWQTTCVPAGASSASLNGIGAFSTTLGASAVNVTTFRGLTLAVNTAAGYSGTVTTGSALQVSDVSIAGTNPFTNYSAFIMAGISNGSGNTSGTITNSGVAVNAITAVAGAGGTIVNRALDVSMPTGVNAGTTTNTGVSIVGNGQTGGATNWAINSSSTAQSQLAGKLIMSGAVLGLGAFTVATLPTASANTGSEAYVTDSNAASFTVGIGAVVAAGGTTVVPVFSDGTNWRIG